MDIPAGVIQVRTGRKAGMAINATAAASMTYHAGAYSDPPARWVAHVRSMGAKPPNTVKAPL